eukprot:TRINITY_DN121413_c0_g1_i1.p1 TRINITY_DN121413_c0_g1~~TRINITY_DN121413_c0_g1_i1.p1  ORF type:complete len:205 (-),score=37.81 TRINITY_DN121413_c0_g1_i1:570-1184(-)
MASGYVSEKPPERGGEAVQSLTFHTRKHYGCGGSYEEQTNYDVDFTLNPSTKRFEVHGTVDDYISGCPEDTPRRPYKATGSLTLRRGDCSSSHLTFALKVEEEQGKGYYGLLNDGFSSTMKEAFELKVSSSGEIHLDGISLASGLEGLSVFVGALQGELEDEEAAKATAEKEGEDLQSFTFRARCTKVVVVVTRSRLTMKSISP